MLQPQNKTIGSMTFQFLPMPALKAARLDKKVLTVLAPLLASLQDLKVLQGMSEGENDFDVGGLATGLVQALQSLDDTTFTGLLRELFEHVTYLPSGKAPMSLSDEATLNEIFVGNLAAMYQVAVEVMRFNKFTPFALADIGGGLLQTVGSVSQSASPKKTGLKLGQSANSQRS
jgi:hypothetical protein